MAILTRGERRKPASGVGNSSESEILDPFVVLVIVSSSPDSLEVLPDQVLPAASQV